jgi:transposase-like protein
MSDNDSDGPGVEGGTVLCPVCDSANTEEIGGGVSTLDYHCGDCGAEFDPTDGRVDVE